DQYDRCDQHDRRNPGLTPSPRPPNRASECGPPRRCGTAALGCAAPDCAAPDGVAQPPSAVQRPAALRAAAPDAAIARKQPKRRVAGTKADRQAAINPARPAPVNS